MADYIYSMVRARKAVGDKVILDDVTMAFLPGAKIGVVGPNGAGKSTILKIMAGLDHPSNGEARLTPGYTVGILMQEPVLDESKTVLENVQEGVGPIKAKLDRFNEISAAMADPDADFDKLLAEMGTLQEDIDAFVESIGVPVRLMGWSGGGPLVLGAAERTDAATAVATWESGGSAEAQARPSASAPASISRSTFHSRRSITATFRLWSQET